MLLKKEGGYDVGPPGQYSDRPGTPAHYNYPRNN